MPGLTERQAAALTFVRDYAETHGHSPSVRDVAAWLGISAEGARKHLDALERKGRIVRARKQPRSIAVVDTRQPTPPTEVVR